MNKTALKTFGLTALIVGALNLGVSKLEYNQLKREYFAQAKISTRTDEDEMRASQYANSHSVVSNVESVIDCGALLMGAYLLALASNKSKD